MLSGLKSLQSLWHMKHEVCLSYWIFIIRSMHFVSTTWRTIKTTLKEKCSDAAMMTRCIIYDVATKSVYLAGLTAAKQLKHRHVFSETPFRTKSSQKTFLNLVWRGGKSFILYTLYSLTHVVCYVTQSREASCWLLLIRRHDEQMIMGLNAHVINKVNIDLMPTLT